MSDIIIAVDSEGRFRKVTNILETRIMPENKLGSIDVTFVHLNELEEFDTEQFNILSIVYKKALAERKIRESLNIKTDETSSL